MEKKYPFDAKLHLCILAQIQLKTPVVSCQTRGTRIEFKCLITRIERTATVYEVKWYEQPIGGGTRLIKKDILTGSKYVSFMRNSNRVRLFRLGVNVSKIIIFLLNYDRRFAILCLPT